MDGFGTLRDKLDIKIFILYILRRLPEALPAEKLAGIALADGNVGYFEFAECLAELKDNDMVSEAGDCFRITDKGAQNCIIVENSLPYSVRNTLEKKLEPVIEAMRRKAMITAEHELNDTGCRVFLSLSDGISNVLEMKVVCADEVQAEKIETVFRDNAEKKYNQIMELLMQ